MVAELVETALKMPKYRDVLQEAEEQGATIPPKEDPRAKKYQTQTRVEDETFSPAQLAQLAELMGAKVNVVARKTEKLDDEMTERMKPVGRTHISDVRPQSEKQSTKSRAK